MKVISYTTFVLVYKGGGGRKAGNRRSRQSRYQKD